MVFISHIHLDHCVGLFYLLQKRDELLALDAASDPKKDIYIMLSTNLAPLVRVFNKYSYQFASHNKFVMTNEFVRETKADESSSEEAAAAAASGDVTLDFDDLKGVLAEGQKLEPYEHPK